MDTESNIDKFNRYAGFFLDKLYSNFPIPTLLDSHEAAYGTPLDGSGPDGSISLGDLQQASCDGEISFCSHALSWLHSTGYFSGAARMHNIQFKEAVLTPRGFEALNATPAALESRGTLGKQLGTALSAGSKEAGHAVISQIVGQIVGTAARGFLTS
ncbi:MAG: hypothetical protein ABL864_03895 [Terricaulis sp.]